jgi:hypothetical protein
LAAISKEVATMFLPTIWRSRWAAIGAAVAVTLGAGGLITANAATDPSLFVPITPTRVLDTRIGAGLSGQFVSDQGRDLDVTGTIVIVGPNDTLTTGAPVPDGATGIVANVTAVGPSTAGYVSVRPGGATNTPTTSNLNVKPGDIVPNAVTVALAVNGTINLWYHGGPGATAHLLVDIVGYYVTGSGTPGPKGDTGATGPRGLSAWDVIPSGQTITGEVKWDAHVPTVAGASDFISVSLGAIAPVDISSSAVSVKGGSDAAPECTGSATTPTAPPGRVCIYPFGSDGTSASTWSGVSLTNLIRHGFGFQFTPTPNTNSPDMYIYFTWAYTAP